MQEQPDPWTAVQTDARIIRERLGPADSLVVLGSGWAHVGEKLGDARCGLAMSELSGGASPTVAGHRGSITLVEVGGRPVLVAAGRVHLYEGHSAASVVHAVRCAVLAGCTSVLLTNAAGSLRTEVGIGTPVVLSDQLNLTGSNPQVGPGPPENLGSRFTDLTELYSARLRRAALDADPTAVEGVYAGLLGGSFETPAEIRMLSVLGADLVGMSTVLEAIAAKQLGAEVFGVSLVTNLAAGLQPSIDAAEVFAEGDRAASRLSGLLRAVLNAL